jgi:hypothetical protein
MQTRQWWLLNVALAGVAALMAVRLGADWKRGNERYALLARRSVATAEVPVIAGANVPPPTVGEIISKNLFSADRSSERPQEVVAPVAGALPVVIGTMRFGADYEALMSEGGGQPGTQRFRRIKTGGQVGPYTVVEIRDEAVVVEFRGQRTTVNVYQSAKSVMRAAATPTPAAPRAPAAPVVDTVAAPPPTPAATVTATPAPAAANTGTASRRIGDVTVTIEGNRRRYERWSMFGPQVWYEDIK